MEIKIKKDFKMKKKDGAGNNNKDRVDKDEVVRGRKGGRCF